MGIIEELRGIAQRKCNCYEVARMLGFECGESPCSECIPRLVGAIAQRVEKERALPDGVEWPRFEDGEPVRFGDEVDWDGDVMRVGSVWLHREGWGLHVSSTGVEGTFHGEYCKRVKRPAPKVLDADGAPIKVGDVVYFVGGAGVRYAVKDIGFEPGGAFVDIIDEKVRGSLMVSPEKLTHERPDSWERIEEDAKLAPRDYLEKRGMNPEKTERIASMMADLVRRAKALAKAGEVE